MPPHPVTTVAVSPKPGRRGGFTLVELMVVMIILSILASLTLAGLAGARTRSKIDKTKSTIRKIHEIVIPHYEGFAEKRVAGPLMLPGTGTPPADYGTYTDVCVRLADNSVYFKEKNGWVGPSAKGREVIARSRIYKIRILQLLDLPDQWKDVVGGTSAAAKRYQAFVQNQNAFAMTHPSETSWDSTTERDRYQSAECLYLVVARGGFAGDAVENFRADEIGDVDGDGAPEFHDAWGRPIMFVRWPAGFTKAAGISRATQLGDPTIEPDPFDPMRVMRDEFRITPLIFSGGPGGAGLDPTADEDSYGLIATAWGMNNGWIPPDGPGVGSISAAPATIDGTLPGGISTQFPRAYLDNITNHDLITK